MGEILANAFEVDTVGELEYLTLGASNLQGHDENDDESNERICP